MQPPPRKVKHASALKVIHTEQLQKLQSKHQQEVELLEDIRVFSQKRSAIEKEYAQSLLKLTSSLLKKDIAIPPDIPSEDGKNHKQSAGSEFRTAIIVWRQILEELEKVAKARLAASEIYYEKCAEPAKPLKNAKVQCLKKLVNQLSLIQSEVAQSVLEMTKAHKIYVTDETQTSEARQKANEADEKLKRKSVGFFKSMTSLQRNCAKLSSRYEQCAIKSTSSRNDYLLAQSAANAHQIRYYSVDLPELMKALDGEVYEKIQEYFTIHTATSAEVSAIETNCFQKLSLEAEKISRNYNLQCFLHESNVFTDLLQYQFEPCCNDQINKLSKEHGAEHQLVKETKKYASRISKETKIIREQSKALRIHQNASKTDQGGGTSTDKSDSTGQDPESQVEEVKQNIRRAETGKMKAEARIELLRSCGVNVDEYLASAQIDSLGAEPGSISRTPSQASLRTESSGGPTEEPEPTYTHFDDDDDFVEEIPDVTEATPMSPTTQNSSSSRQYPIQAQALYTFQATNPDELGMEENEDIEVIGDGDGDGWVQAKDSRGNVGFIPESYIRILDQTGSAQSAVVESAIGYDVPTTSVDMSQTSSTPHGALSTPDLPPAPDIPPATDMSTDDLETPTGQESDMPPPPDFTVTNHMEPPNEPTQYDVASSFSSGDLEVQQATASSTTEPTLQNLPLVPNDGEVWARALYDYEANTDDELSFTEGTLIRIVRKDETGIDDGFWQGEIDGQFGVFPSLVVEELVENGEPKQDLLTPVKGGPPDFVPPPPVMVTLPTPDRITPPFLSNGQASSSASTAESSTDPNQPALDSQQSTVDAVGSGDASQVPAGSEVPESTIITEEKQSTEEAKGSTDKFTGLQDQIEEDKKETSQNSEAKTGSIDQTKASDKVQSQEQFGSLDKADSLDQTFSEQSGSFDQTGSLDRTGSIDDDGNDATQPLI